jgi:hypothetical protein
VGAGSSAVPFGARGTGCSAIVWSSIAEFTPGRTRLRLRNIRPGWWL